MPFDKAVAVDENFNLPGPVLSRLREVLKINRTTTTIVTESLAPGTRKSGTITLGDEYQLISTQFTSKARLRLYVTAANMASDLDRAIGTDPSGKHGVILDVNMDTTDVLNLSPQVLGATPTGETLVYYALDNMDSVPRVITATIISRRLE